jgi:hypothetical protein
MNPMPYLSRLRQFAAISLMSTVLVAVPVSPASSAVPTRSQYVEQAEPICKAGTLANQTILRGVQNMVRHGKLKRAASRFLRAANALERVVKQLANVPRPPNDADRLVRWLGHARAGGALLGRIGHALGEGRQAEAEDMADQLLREARRANAVVVGFDFNYCRLNPARFV